AGLALADGGGGVAGRHAVPDAGHHRRLPRSAVRPEQGQAAVHDSRHRGRPAMNDAEFDRHAAGYDGGLDNPVKRLMGNSADQFIAVKARWLLRREPELRSGELALLDYGCGAGDLLRVLGRLGMRAGCTGCDVSTGMLDEARKRWPDALGPAPVLVVQDGPLAPFGE